MRKLGMMLALALGVAARAEAGAVPFSGSLAVRIAELEPIESAGSGIATVAVVSGSHVDALSIPASAFAVADFALAVTDPLAFPIAGILATFHNAAGHFEGSPIGGPMSINGVTKVCLFAPCALASANLTVPISAIGAGGSQAASNLVDVTLAGAPWTAGTAAIGTITEMGFNHGPASASSSTAAASGALRLVTPVFLSTNIAAATRIPAFGILSLHFVPEPGTLLLLGSSIAGLLLLARRPHSGRMR